MARELDKAGWRLALLARRIDRLKTLAAALDSRVSVGYVDVSKTDCIESFNAMIEGLGGADLVIISAGCGYLNPTDEQEEEMVAVNIAGFRAIAQAACRHFQTRGHGHLAAITYDLGARNFELHF